MATRAEHPPSMRRWVKPLVAAAAIACLLLGAWAYRAGNGPSGSSPLSDDQLGRRFVLLARALGRIAPQEVDGDFGPAIAGVSDSGPIGSLPQLKRELERLSADIRAVPMGDDPRRERLARRTDHLLALVDSMISSDRMPFDAEQRRLFGLPPTQPRLADYAAARAALERLLPGPGSLTTRVEAFRRALIIPERARPAVFAAALAECRRRTAQHWRLPSAERLDVDWTGAVDAAWHRYRGHYRSSLQINPAAVAFVGSAVDVACHEGYPGHHAQFVLADAAAAQAGGPPVEDMIVLLRSPGSLLREGAAEYGLALVFPVAERLAFERRVLFPLAGLPVGDAARYEQVRQLLYDLAPAALPILRAYRDGAIDRSNAAAALDREALIASPQALLSFVDTLGAYAAGYTAAREQVRQAVDMPGGSDAMRWGRLARLIRSADDAPLDRARARPQPGAAPPVTTASPPNDRR
jgi:hypothetical protein